MTQQRAHVSPEIIYRDFKEFRDDVSALLADLNAYLDSKFVPEHILPSAIQGSKLLKRAEIALNVAVMAADVDIPDSSRAVKSSVSPEASVRAKAADRS